jgi:hypothetical protein
MKYTVWYEYGVAVGIATKTKGVLRSIWPSQEELLPMSRKEVREWTRTNNRRLRKVCKFLNENKL